MSRIKHKQTNPNGYDKAVFSNRELRTYSPYPSYKSGPVKQLVKNGVPLQSIEEWKARVSQKTAALPLHITDVVYLDEYVLHLKCTVTGSEVTSKHKYTYQILDQKCNSGKHQTTGEQ